MLTQDKDSLVHNVRDGVNCVVAVQTVFSPAEHVHMFSLSHISVRGSPLLPGDRDE